MPTTDQHRRVEPGERLAGPGVELVHGRGHLGLGWGGGRRGGDLLLEPTPAADPVQADDDERQQRGDDDEELQHLVVDRRRQATEGDVRQHDQRGDDERDPQRPAEQRVHDRAEQVEVDAGDEQLRDREGDGVDQVRLGAEPPEHELGDRAHLRAVVERHHHDTEEEHRRDGADPEVVHRRDADLGAVGRHPHDLDGAEVGRDERQTRHPRRQRAPRQEEVERVGDRPAGDQPDAEHEHEVHREDEVVDGTGVDQRLGPHCRRCAAHHGLRKSHHCDHPSSTSRPLTTPSVATWSR